MFSSFGTSKAHTYAGEGEGAGQEQGDVIEEELYHGLVLFTIYIYIYIYTLRHRMAAKGSSQERRVCLLGTWALYKYRESAPSVLLQSCVKMSKLAYAGEKLKRREGAMETRREEGEIHMNNKER